MLLNPIWLFAVAAVVIPGAIHLWNIRPGKVLKVGSISLIDAASRKSSRSLKLIDIPLFIVRCLLLIVLALILAAPLWQKKLLTSKVKGWILIPKVNLQAAYAKFKPSIDSLMNAGYEFHYFDRGFPKSDLKQILLDPKDSISKTDTQRVNYWNLVRQLDTVVTSTLPVYIFTPNQAQYFTGEKPQVALNLHWQNYVPADSTSTWIQSARFNNDNTIRVAQGISKSFGTTYSYANIKTGDQPNSPYAVTVANGMATVGLKANSQQAVTVDTSTLRIAVYADNNTMDAGYLNAALQAVTQFTQRKTVVKQYSNASLIPANQSWLFWLVDKPIPGNLFKRCNNILRYEKGTISNSDSWVNNSAFSVSLQQDHKIALFKFIETAPTDATTIWRDGFGHPILTLQKQSNTKVYNFYSRFNPTWNDLVWSDEFPSWIMKLTIGEKETIADKNDRRTLAQQQLMPDITSQAHATVAKSTGFVNLANYCWLLLALLFAAERWMAHKTQNAINNG